VVGGRFGLWEGLLLEWLPLMRQAAPDIAVRAEIGFEEDLMQGLVEGRIDIGVMYTTQSRPGLIVERLLEERLVLVSTKENGVAQPEESYVYIDWGAEFYAQHGVHFPDYAGAGVVANVGWLGLQHILQSGGSGYFPLRLVAPHLETGGLERRPLAPEFRLPAYAVYPDEPSADVVGLALGVMRQIAAGVSRSAGPTPSAAFPSSVCQPLPAAPSRSARRLQIGANAAIECRQRSLRRGCTRRRTTRGRRDPELGCRGSHPGTIEGQIRGCCSARSMRVVRERLDNAAVAHAASSTLLDHPLELGLEYREAGEPLFDLRELAPRELIDGIARLLRTIRQAEQLADRLEREAELAAVPDEGQAVGVPLVVTALVASRARRLRHEPDLLVVADRLHLAASCPRKVANPDLLAGHPIAP
jgi:hypothetical protein